MKMPVCLTKPLVIAVSSEALFSTGEDENETRVESGELLSRGHAFPLVKALLEINSMMTDEKKLEIIVLSRAGADESIKLFNSIEHYGLDIARAAIVGQADIAPYLTAFKADAFLSESEVDVRQSLRAGIASGALCNFPDAQPEGEKQQIRLAFLGEAVRFSEEGERIYETYGMRSFLDYERENAQKPVPDGAYAKLIRLVSQLQRLFPENTPVRTALVSRCGDLGYERVVLALRAWGVRTDEAFFLMEGEKYEVLRAFGADIFFNGAESASGESTSCVSAASPLIMSV